MHVLVLPSCELAARVGVDFVVIPGLARGELVGADEVRTTVLQVEAVQPHVVLAVESSELNFSHSFLFLVAWWRIIHQIININSKLNFKCSAHHGRLSA